MPAPSTKSRSGGSAGIARNLASWIVLPLLAVSPALTAQDESLALWKTQEINFTYRSSTSIYSCGALRSRVTSVLRAVGAHEDLKVSVSNCSDFLFGSDDQLNSPLRPRFGSPFGAGRGPTQFASVRIRLRNPIPATPEAIAEMEKSKGYRELLGRVTGSSDAIQEAAAQFPAQRELVSLSYKTLRLEPEECELLEQMMAQVFPKLGVRVVANSMTCIPRQVSQIKPRVEVEAFIRSPQEAAGAEQAPASESEESAESGQTSGATSEAAPEPTGEALPEPASVTPPP